MSSRKGSEWNKWDLHIHTPASLCSDYGGDTEEIWDKFINELEDLPQEVKVIGINDYLFIDGYKKVIEYRKKGRLKNIDLILPVIEFRLKEFVGNKELKRLNYHVIFADEKELDLSIIETHFLAGLKGKANLLPLETEGVSWGGVVTKESLVELGKKIYYSIPKEKRDSNKNFFEIGFNNINFEISKIEELLGEKGEPNTFLKNKYFKAIGKSEWESFRWDGSIADKKNIINSTHFIFSASPNIDTANKGKKSLEMNNVNSRLLHCSDSHQFCVDKGNTKPKELGHCYTWIKAEKTFEGLRQVVFEPELRCRIQVDNPDKKLPHKNISSIKFINHPWFTDKEIYFNNDLNTIIGGKSSGKSLLLHYLANTINFKYALKQQFSSSKKLNELVLSVHDKYGFSNENNFDFEVKWNDGVIYKFSEREVVKDRSFVYIPQSYILNLTDNIEKKSRKILGKFIRDILLQEPSSRSSYNIFIEKVKELDRLRNNLIDNYFRVEDEINRFNKEKRDIGDKEGIKNHITNQTLIIDELKRKSNIGEEDLKKYSTLKYRLEKANEVKLNILEESKILSDKVNDTIYGLGGLLDTNNLNKNNFKSKAIGKTVDEFNSIINKTKQDLSTLYHNIPRKKEEVNVKADSIIKELEKMIKPISEKLKDRGKIENIEKSLKSERDKISKIERIEYKISNELEKEQVTIKLKLFESYEKAYNEYVNIIELLNTRGEDFSDINLIGSVKFYFSRFRNNFLITFFNLGSTANKELKDLNICKEYNENLPNIDFENHLIEIKEAFEKIVNDKFVLKKYKEKKDCIKALLKDEFFDYWELKVGNDEMANMSPGKANLVILKLLIELSDANSPILIDQPEDNLDNRSIYNDLVKFIRKRKEDRQMLIVSHNPNVVVAADSENIIIANQKDQDKDRANKNFRFEFINGAIENTFKLSELKAREVGVLDSMGVREHIAELLEGGKEAFKKREEKYGF